MWFENVFFFNWINKYFIWIVHCPQKCSGGFQTRKICAAVVCERMLCVNLTIKTLLWTIIWDLEEVRQELFLSIIAGMSPEERCQRNCRRAAKPIRFLIGYGKSCAMIYSFSPTSSHIASWSGLLLRIRYHQHEGFITGLCYFNHREGTGS